MTNISVSSFLFSQHGLKYDLMYSFTSSNYINFMVYYLISSMLVGGVMHTKGPNLSVVIM